MIHEEANTATNHHVIINITVNRTRRLMNYHGTAKIQSTERWFRDDELLVLMPVSVLLLLLKESCCMGWQKCHKLSISACP